MIFLSFLMGLSLTVNIGRCISSRCNLRVCPQNAAVIAGQMMGIECRTHNGSVVREWTLSRASRGENHKLQQHLNNEKIFSHWNSGTKPAHLAQFSVDVDQYGSGTLYSNSTALEDAGLYTCVVEIGLKLTRWSAHLIVFESIPFCETNLNTTTGNSLMEGDRIWMRCSVRFRGYLKPSMEWRQHGEDKDGRIIAADEVMENENFNVTSTLSVVFKSFNNKTFFSCKIYYSSQTHRRLANATNAPNFSYLWKSPEVIQIHTVHPVTNPTPLITTPWDKGNNSSANLFLVPFTGVATLAAFFCVVTTILCIRMKRKSTAILITMPANEVDRSMSPGQTAVSRSSLSLYENIDDETAIPMQIVQDAAYLTVLHTGSRTSLTSSVHGGGKSDSVSLCTTQQIPAIDKGYENAEIWDSNQPSQVVQDLPNSDAEFPSPGENYPLDLNGETTQDDSACEDVSYIKVAAQVRGPAQYESLQPSSAHHPHYGNTDVAT